MLAPRRSQTSHRPRSPIQLLVAVGMPRNRITTSKIRNDATARSYKFRKAVKSSPLSLWNRSEWELLDLLREAKDIYKKRIKQLHPDMPGGSHAKAAHLNLAWDGVVRMFRNHGVTL